ncbi:hypothetical protein LINGRAHAP2_LOCUS27522 [Linum grandiflorum]
MIKVFSWNYCGAGHDDFITTFKRYSSQNKPSVAIICEPRISGDTALDVISKMGFDEFVRVDAVGFCGGIWVLWHSQEISLSSVSSSTQFIHMEGKNDTMGVFYLTAIYGNPSAQKLDELWDALRNLTNLIINPWMLIGDFNALLASNEKKGGAEFSRRKHQPFINCVADCGLIGCRVKGPQFMWH